MSAGLDDGKTGHGIAILYFGVNFIEFDDNQHSNINNELNITEHTINFQESYNVIRPQVGVDLIENIRSNPLEYLKKHLDKLYQDTMIDYNINTSQEDDPVTYSQNEWDRISYEWYD